MPKDHLERKTYRKSPGRQYGYDYDPLRSRTGSDGSAAHGETASRAGTQLVQRPDPRRTRQLLRRSIIASKIQAEDMETDEYAEPAQQVPYQPMYEEPLEEQILPGYRPQRAQHRHGYVPRTRELPETEEELGRNRRSYSPSGRLVRSYIPVTRNEPEPLEEDGQWQDYTGTDYEDLLEPRSARLPVRRQSASLRPRQEVREQIVEEDEQDSDDGLYAAEDYEDQRPPVGRLKKKTRLSRRGLLMGVGAVALGGAGVVALELAPKMPTIGNVGANLEHQVQDAFNRGVTQGANDARKEILTALDNLEGVTLTGAIDAAALTRVAYDVFVSPIVHFGTGIASDFLDAMLSAFKSGRTILKNVYQDNATLGAIQSVLQTWSDNFKKMPKQLDTITQTDLDGAQAYLRALQRKIADEQAKLNNPTPTPKPNVPATPKSTH